MPLGCGVLTRAIFLRAFADLPAMAAEGPLSYEALAGCFWRIDVF
ncbi:hypothetical protein [Bradyrhizobium sp. DASA03007]